MAISVEKMAENLASSGVQDTREGFALRLDPCSCWRSPVGTGSIAKRSTTYVKIDINMLIPSYLELRPINIPRY